MAEFDFDKLIPRMGNRSAFRQVFADVGFVHSWRAVRAPLYYENEDPWYAEAADYAAAVFRYSFEAPVARLISEHELAVRALAVGEANYEKNRAVFNGFLEGIQVQPEGPAGDRMLQSMWDFLALAAAHQIDVDTGRKRSFFFPFC